MRLTAFLREKRNREGWRGEGVPNIVRVLSDLAPRAVFESVR